ncbi:hypothetical protein PXNS11_350106 [Stutzerimonas xanthomarina]|nr:hypothetical protein PXNS11_350106 [Stutzerimonas xanthomarina]
MGRRRLRADRGGNLGDRLALGARRLVGKLKRIYDGIDTAAPRRPVKLCARRTLSITSC